MNLTKIVREIRFVKNVVLLTLFLSHMNLFVAHFEIIRKSRFIIIINMNLDLA